MAKVAYDVNIFLAAKARAKESQHVAEAEARPARFAGGGGEGAPGPV